MATTEKTISGLIESQLPDFINAKYEENAPSFRRFIELYYTWLEDEAQGNTVYHIMNSEKYRDIDETEDGFISYFKNELLPYFPERTELELVKILKGAKEFYQKKGTEKSIEWLFRVLFNKEALLTYPRENILRASDGKWQLPISIKVTDTPLIVQTATSTENLYVRQPTTYQQSHYTLGTEYTTTAEFDNTVKRNSVIFAFSSYKVWVVSATSAATLKANLENYLTSNISSTVSDVDGFEYQRLNDILISNADTSYGVNTKLFNVVEGFYNNSTIPENKQVLFSTKLTEKSLASIFSVSSSNVRIQFDGIKAYEVGNLEKYLVSSNTSYTYATTSASSILAVDAEDAPCYVFTFAKQDDNHLFSTDLSGSTIIANTYFNSDGFIFKSKLKYQSENVTSTFTTATPANIATISFSFKKKSKIPLKSLEKKLVIGETSKAQAVIEKVYDRVDEFSRLKYSELFLSNVQGEFINNEIIYVELDDTVFSERILGFVTDVSIDPNNRGLRYSIGDPAVIYGGNDTSVATAGFKYATAEVEEITKGIIKSLTLTDGGYGYRADPNTTVTVVRGDGDTTGTGATVKVGSVDTGNGITIPLSTDTIAPYVNNLLTANPFQRVTGAGTFNGFPNNALANLNSTLSSCFSYTNQTFYPISSLILLTEGTGYSKPPTLSYNTFYQVDGTTNLSISSLGYVAAVRIISGGTGYANGEIIRFNGTSSVANGYINVSPSGAITNVTLTSRGYGYTFSDTSRPTVTIATGSGVGASLKAYGFNDGAAATITVDEVGAIQKIKTTNVGFGYTSKPNVSLKVMDVYVGNLSFAFSTDQVLSVYQGPDIANATFTGIIDLGYASENNQAGSSNATIRVYDYNGTFNVARSLMITQTNEALSSLGNRVYGNGFAKANLVFIDGTVTYPGFFLNTDGFVSADKKLQDKNKYHNFSYVLESTKQLNEFNRTLFNIVHPIGSELIAHTRIDDVFDQRNIISYTNAISVSSNTAAINSGPEFFPNYYVAGANANLNLSSANTSKLIANGTTNFITLRVNTSTAGITSNDTIIINYDNPDRKIVRTVLNTPSSTILNISQPIIIFGYGYLSTNNSTYVTISENVESKIIANDRIRIFDKADYDVTGNDNHVYVRKVITVTNNLIELDSTVPISNTNLGYCIDPHLLNAKIKVIREI